MLLHFICLIIFAPRTSAQTITAQNDLFPVLENGCNYYLDVKANDDLDTFSNFQLQIVNQPVSGTAFIIVSNSGYLSYCSFSTFEGTDQFQYSVSAGGLTDTATVYINILPSNNQVYPGDADQNGTVEHFDVLSVGLAYGEVGPSRDTTSNDALAWQPLLFLNSDPGATDCNADGIIAGDDVIVIDSNFFTTFPIANPYEVDTSACTSSGIPFSIVSLSGDSIDDGDSLRISIRLGDSGLLNEAYGIAFTLEFDNGFVGGSNIQFSTDSSWLVQNDTALFFKKDFQQTGELRVALTKTNHNPALGGGEIMQAILPIDDNIDGVVAAPGWHDLKLHLARVRLVSEYDIVRDICVEQPAVKVQKVTTSSKQPRTSSIKIFPNPGNGRLMVEGENILEVTITDLAGKEIFKSRTPAQKNLMIDLGSIAPGNYVATVKTTDTVFVQKIFIQQ